jgi:hypothetical protein
MDWRESVLGDGNNRSTRYSHERVTRVAVDECVVQLYADLASDPSLSAEDTEPKA